MTDEVLMGYGNSAIFTRGEKRLEKVEENMLPGEYLLDLRSIVERI